MRSESIVLETSSYLPLLWRTPYSYSVAQMMVEYADEHEFLLQCDCVAEAAGLLSFEGDWRYDPAIRFRHLIDKMTDDELRRLPYPSTAVQLLLGGSIWTQARYLNHVRHMAFFLIDLLDDISFKSPREGLLECARRIEERICRFRELFRAHQSAQEVWLPQRHILSYWGTWYLQDPPEPFRIRMVDDPWPYTSARARLRDLYHYQCALTFQPPPAFMLVANTGFAKRIEDTVATMPFPVVSAETTRVFQ